MTQPFHGLGHETSSAETWSSQLIEYVLPSGAEGEGAAESLPVMILEAVGVLRPGLTSSSSLSSSSEEEEGLGDAFLKSSAAETLLEECLTVR